MRKLALIGNPNSGKTTLFNVLTGANQKVGNWPGVTVEKKYGQFELGGESVELVDLPGIYSLEQDYQGLDEKIAQDYLLQNPIDLVINIIDATNLERSLVLTQQLLEMQLPMVVVLNMLDVATQQGIKVDAPALSAQLAIPVLPVIASRKKGIAELLAQLQQAVAQQPVTTRAKPQTEASADKREANDEKVLRRYHRSRELVNGVIEVSPDHHSLSEKIDSVLINRWLGVPFFLLMIYLMFAIAVNLGAVFIDFFDHPFCRSAGRRHQLAA